MLAAAGERRTVFVLADIDVTHDLFDGVGINYRPHVSLRIHAVAYTQHFGALDQFLREPFVYFLVDDQTRRSSATLSGSAESAPERAFDREIDIGVVQHHDDVLAAHLERADAVAFRARRSDQAACFSRTCKRDQTQRRMVCNCRANIRAVSRYQVNHARRNSRLFACFDQVVS